MNIEQQYSPIFITGAERSGSTLVAKILSMCGVSSGECNNMFEHYVISSMTHDLVEDGLFSMPNTDDLMIPVKWKEKVMSFVGIPTNSPWMIKQSLLSRTWSIWNYSFPDSKWIIVRRRTGDIIQSCMKTGYMKLFKNETKLNKLHLTKEEEGWLWWVHEYEKRFVEMVQSGLNCRIVWPDRMVVGNYQQMYETVEWLGLKWNNKIPEVIGPLLEKSKSIVYENNV